MNWQRLQTRADSHWPWEIEMPRPRELGWYGLARWRRMRLDQLRKDPLCAMCRPEHRLADTVDHVKPHRGDPELFWNPDNLQSLCTPCHSRDKQRIERGGQPLPKRDADGWPVWPNPAKGR